ncbi:MAG: ABC transporter ATP-binding protein [Candidatus Cloacimonadia bacterium]
MGSNVKWVINEWKRYPYAILVLLILTLISTVVAVIYPYVIKQLIDTLYSELANPIEHIGISPEINKIIWIFIVIGLVKLTTALSPGIRGLMNVVFEYTLRNRYYEYILKKDHKFFNKFRTGDLITRLTSDITGYTKISWFMCSAIFRAVESFSKILFCIVAMLFLNVKLALLTLAPLPIMMIVYYMLSSKFRSYFQSNQQAISEINNQLEMSFSGIKIIKAFASEEKYHRFFKQALNDRYHTEMNVVRLNTRVHMIYEYIDYLGQIMIILFGGIMVVKGEITVGTFLAFYTYLAMIVFPMLDLPQLFVAGKQAFVNIGRLEEIREFPTPITNQNEKIAVDKIESITFENVSFAYQDQGELILNNVSFNVKKGERVIIIGPVGSGKSTILGLISGLLKPQSGLIKINGIHLEEIDLVKLRDKIGYVPQEPILFTGSIKENVMFGKGDVSDEVYEKVLRIVQMEKEIARFTDGDETRVGQRGLSLSGGQKQRLSIARALIKEPEVLIFDDITASLDAENEENLWKDISATLGDVTSFIVSHRLSTLRYVDNVIFIDEGALVARGEHSKLLRENGEYKTFIREHSKEKNEK